MRSIRSLSVLLAVTSCTDRQSTDRSREGEEKSEGEGSRVKVPPIVPEQLARKMAETRAAYDANMGGKDRVFGSAFARPDLRG